MVLHSLHPSTRLVINFPLYTIQNPEREIKKDEDDGERTIPWSSVPVGPPLAVTSCVGRRTPAQVHTGSRSGHRRSVTLCTRSSTPPEGQGYERPKRCTWGRTEPTALPFLWVPACYSPRVRSRRLKGRIETIVLFSTVVEGLRTRPGRRPRRVRDRANLEHGRVTPQ